MSLFQFYESLCADVPFKFFGLCEFPHNVEDPLHVEFTPISVSNPSALWNFDILWVNHTSECVYAYCKRKNYLDPDDCPFN